MKLIKNTINFEASCLAAPSGAGDANMFRPLCDQILTQFSKLMETYQALEEEK